jgi:hypothetical protein
MHHARRSSNRARTRWTQRVAGMCRADRHAGRRALAAGWLDAFPPQRRSPRAAETAGGLSCESRRRGARDDRAVDTLHPPRYRLVAARLALADGPDDTAGR